MSLREPSFALLAFVLALAVHSGSAVAGAPYTVTHEIRVKVDARLQLMGLGDELAPHRALLQAPQNERMSFSRSFDVGAETFEVHVRMTPSVDLEREICRVEIDARVSPPGAESLRVSQAFEVHPERARLVELWSGSRMDERLVLAFTTSWESVPQVSVLRPGAEPLAVVLEVLDEARVVQRHELAAIVGESSSFMVRHEPPALEDAGETPETRAEVTFLPKSIEGGEVDLSVSLVVERADNDDPYRIDLRERLSPGFSLSLPLPSERDGPPRVTLRVTPWF